MAARQFEYFPNLVTLFFKRAADNGDKPFLTRKSGGVWHSISWTAAAQQVASLAAGLKSIGLKTGDRVMLVSENRPEWCIADLAIMAAGCVTVPTYVTNTERDHQHIIEDSGASAIIVSTPKLAQTVMPAAIRATRTKHLIGIEELRVGQATGVKIHNWANLVGTEADVAACADFAEANYKRDDLACIIYTSGTGGSPRGVMQHHGAILLNVEGAAMVISEDFGWGDEVFLSFLPLSHAYEHTGGQFLPIGMGGQIAYAEGLEKLMANMEEIRPTIMVVVPRLFEVIRARVLKTFEKEGKFKQGLLRRALNLGTKQLDQGKVALFDKPMNLFIDKTLRPAIQKRFGGRIKALVSGGAPLNPDIGVFFHSLGLTLLQGYGQTEAGPVISCNRPSAGIRMDTVGPPLKGVEVKIADDGEILVRGELVMQGYWHNEAETARAIQDGWLHTGDIGEIDSKGRVKITDRKKDIIVNDKGENVAPQKIEGMLTLQPEIYQAMVSGDKRPHMVALIVPDPEWAVEWAQKNGEAYNLRALCDLPAFKSAVMAAVDEVNKQLAVTEKVRKIALTPDGFTIENEMLTPSQKIRRHVIRQTYSAQVDALYGG
jgi:long-chain acyl-CoA synthetase